MVVSCMVYPPLLRTTDYYLGSRSGVIAKYLGSPEVVVPM